MAELLGTFEQVVLLSVFGLGTEAYGRSVLREVHQPSIAGAFPQARYTPPWTGLKPRGFFHPVLLKVARHAEDVRDAITNSPRAVLPHSWKRARR